MTSKVIQDGKPLIHRYNTVNSTQLFLHQEWNTITCVCQVLGGRYAVICRWDDGWEYTVSSCELCGYNSKVHCSSTNDAWAEHDSLSCGNVDDHFLKCAMQRIPFVEQNWELDTYQAFLPFSNLVHGLRLPISCGFPIASITEIVLTRGTITYFGRIILCSNMLGCFFSCHPNNWTIDLRCKASNSHCWIVHIKRRMRSTQYTLLGIIVVLCSWHRWFQGADGSIWQANICQVPQQTCEQFESPASINHFLPFANFVLWAKTSVIT